MKLIESKTLGTAQAAIEFTSIPGDGTDLVALISLREATTNDVVIFIRLNGDTASNYENRGLQGSGSAASSFSSTDSYFQIIGEMSSSTGNTFGNASIYLTNYTSLSTKAMSSESVEENNATGAFSRLVHGRWSGIVPITSLRFFPVSGNWAIGSTISLYKITKGSDGIVTTS